jgi:hypothetical protein
VVCENAGVVVGITIAATRIIAAAVIADIVFVCI